MRTLLGRTLAGACAALCLVPTALAAPHVPPWGFDLAGRDTATQPGDDFYGYANGTFVRKLAIPADRARFGSVDALQAVAEDRVHLILEKAAREQDPLADDAKVGAYYRAYLDQGRVDALGARPLAPELAEIRAATTHAQIAALMGKGARSFFGSAFDVDIGVDAKDPGHYAVYLGQGGLGLPDRDYYLEPGFAGQKAKYQAYVAQMLTLAGWPDAEAQAQAQAIVELETQIAKVSWSKADQRDPIATYNPMTPAQLAAAAPGFDWGAFLAGAGLGDTTRVVVAERSAVPQIARIFAATPVATLQAWEAFQVADSAAPYLSSPFVDAEFAFRSKALNGQQVQRPRWKLDVTLVSASMGDAVGRLYVAGYFPPASKAKVEALVANIRAALQARIQQVTWMSETTKTHALRKLAMLTVKIGYPTKWRDDRALEISDSDLFGDVERSGAYEWRRKLAQLSQPVDRSEWSMTPQTVNAYYSPATNEIVFPAAILRPPFFDPAADPAVNYGAIGAVIGHEMTHGYDDEGRHYDGDGRLADWWTQQDVAGFVAQTKLLGAQYSAFEPAPGAHVKGDQTMGENLADLGGVLLAARRLPPLARRQAGARC